MDHMISDEDPPPSTKKQLVHIEQIAFQMFVTGFDPIQITIYTVLFFLVKNPNTCAILTKEIRESFKSYEDMNTDALLRLKYLHSVISETLHAQLTTGNGLPRRSLGATVHGVCVPKGVCSSDTPCRQF